MSSLQLNCGILRVAGLWPTQGSQLSRAYTVVAAACQVGLLATQGLALVWGRAGLAAVSLNVCVSTTVAAGVCKGAAFLCQLPTARQLTACLQGCQHSAESAAAARGVTRYYVAVGGAAVVIWNLMPLLLEADRSLPTIAWYPYDETKTPLFELTYLLQGISTFYCCITNVGLNVFLVSLMIYISDELKSLNDSISSINYCSSHNCSCSDDKQIGLLNWSSKIVTDGGDINVATHKAHSKQLRQRAQFCCVVKAQDYLRICLQYHQELIRTVKKLETTMTAIVFTEFVAGIIVTCLTLFHAAVNAGNMAMFLKFIMYLLYMTVGMFIYCWYGQDLIQKLLNASYSYYAVLRQMSDTQK